MNIKWEINNNDVDRLNQFLAENHNYFVQCRFDRNVLKQNIQIDKDQILKAMCMCLLTTQQRSGPNSPVGIFLGEQPFPITYNVIVTCSNVEETIRNTLLHFSLTRYINRITEFFTKNILYLEETRWEIIDSLNGLLSNEANKEIERKMADMIAYSIKGFGPKQARNFLQSLGLTKFEIPIDSRIVTWLNRFGFPIKLSPISLQDAGYYHFVSDGIQHLCEKAGVYPCILDATIFASFDTDEWTQENIVF